jgi:membrane protein YqaA with SNARE-associated domain
MIYILAYAVQYIGQERTQRRKQMKTTKTKKAAAIGAGVGIALFAVFGLIPGSLLGGAAGIKISGMLLGFPLESGLVSRALVLASMLLGVVVSGITIVTATSTAGWLIARTTESFFGNPMHRVEAKVAVRNR